MRVDLVNLLGSGSSPSPSLLAEWRVGAILEAVAVQHGFVGVKAVLDSFLVSRRSTAGMTTLGNLR